MLNRNINKNIIDKYKETFLSRRLRPSLKHSYALRTNISDINNFLVSYAQTSLPQEPSFTKCLNYLA